jgi:hypothetical protein
MTGGSFVRSTELQLSRRGCDITMANQYQSRSYPAGAGHNDQRAQGEGDPLAELARLIGQTDPFAAQPGRPSAAQPPRRAEPAVTDHAEPEEQFDTAPTPPPWMQRVAAQRAAQPVEPEQQHYSQPQPDPEFDFQQPYQQAQHPDAQAYAATGYASQDYAAHEPQAHVGYDAYGHPQQAQAYEQASHHQVDPNRYDEALYGQPDHGQQAYQQDQYQDDPYAYPQGDYADEEPAPKRRSGMKTVAAVLALAVIGTGGAFAYRTFVGSTRSGEPPVIKADPGPNKIVPAATSTASNDSGKQMDRLAAGQERLVPREEQPVNVQDASKAGGPRVVFPPLNQNNNPPTTASVSPANKPMVAANNAVNGDEPRRVRTLAVRGDQMDAAATPAARPAPARPAAPAPAPAVNSNAPMSLSPQQAPSAPATRSAALNTAPQDVAPPPSAATGGYVVQISSQRSDADARASFKALQGKYPSVLGSRSPVIKKADLGDKGTYYRAMVGPFGSADEALQFRKSLEAAGGPQGIVQRN